MVVSFIYFFSVGTVFGYFFTEEKVNKTSVTIFMLMNYIVFIVIWSLLYKHSFRPDKSDCGKRHLFILLAPSLAFAAIDLLLFIFTFRQPSNDVIYGILGMIKYFYLAIYPVGTNASMVVSLADSIDTKYYFIILLFNLLVYDITIIANKIIRERLETVEKE